MQKFKIGAIGSPHLLANLLEVHEAFMDLDLTVFSDAVIEGEEPEQAAGRRIQPRHVLDDPIDPLDCLILATDPSDYLLQARQTFIKQFNTVDNIQVTGFRQPQQDQLDGIARDHGHLALTGVDWAPAYYQMNQILAQAILPQGKTHYLYHANYQPALSQLVQDLEGVQAAAVYLDSAETVTDSSQQPEEASLPSQVIYLVLEDSGQESTIYQTLNRLPQFGLVGDQDVHFIDQASMEALKKDTSPAGAMIHQQVVGPGQELAYEVDLKLSDSSLLQANLLLSYARATVRAYQRGERGAKTMLDLPLSDLIHSEEDQ